MPERIILARGVDDEDLGGLAYLLDWDLGGVQKPPESAAFTKWYVSSEGATVIYVDDPIIGVRFLIVNGPGADVAKAHVLRTVRTLSREAVIAKAEKAKGFDAVSEAGRQLLAAAGDSYDPRVFELLERKYFAHRDPRIRSDMIKLFSYAGWKEFRPLLERLASADKEEDVRAFARTALDAWDAERAGNGSRRASSRRRAPLGRPS